MMQYSNDGSLISVGIDGEGRPLLSWASRGPDGGRPLSRAALLEGNQRAVFMAMGDVFTAPRVG